MENNVVFSSDITRSHNPQVNNLYELLCVNPVEPVSKGKEDTFSVNNLFIPNTGKQYTQKKKSRLKVRTVRDIRKVYEHDVCSYLPSDLAKQQNILLNKISTGSSKASDTKKIAKNIMESEQPLSRTSWQMLININVEEHMYPVQYALWNGKYIRVNGSKGGQKKFICNQTISKKNVSKNVLLYGKKTINKKRGLLQNSLTIKFKPGPLQKKEFLDDSHQKYCVGNVKLVKLPQPEFEIQPKYGVSLEPIMSKFINGFREKNGLISLKWAEFSVSMLGYLKISNPIQISGDCPISFDLSYKYNQRRMLMRRDVINTLYDTNETKPNYSLKLKRDEPLMMPEIKEIIDDILTTVEISIEQDTMFIKEDEPREVYQINIPKLYKPKENSYKDKLKRKFCELDRLDVTIIHLPEDSSNHPIENCNESYCTLGCICNSIRSPLKFKQHCGRIECMFDCRCDFSYYNNINIPDSDCPNLLPSLMHIEKNMRLSKEEKKFHQTVIMSGEKSMLLKSRKRDWKASKKYSDFYKNMCLKNENIYSKELSIVCTKLKCENIEPWCMVHNLYRCFCKGKFTDFSTVSEVTSDIVLESDDVTLGSKKDVTLGSKKDDVTVSCENYVDRNALESKNYRTSERFKTKISHNPEHNSNSQDDERPNKCARFIPYYGRKFTNRYYNNVNARIKEMEKNDSKLWKRLISLMLIKDDELVSNQKSSNLDLICSSRNDVNDQNETSLTEFTDTTNASGIITKNSIHSTEDCGIKARRSVPNNKSLITWLESSYKLHKHRLDKGLVRTSLEAPKYGKLALHTWEFILNRYREHKNLFLVSKHSPSRIFMGVDNKNSLFENCINIDDIRFADLHKYPKTVKNLLTNSNDSNDSFCILYGLNSCWEIIGSVTKTKEQTDGSEISITDQDSEFDTEMPKKNTEIESTDSESLSSELLSASITKSTNAQEKMLRCTSSLESSKWFVMIIENDFTEIQFYKKGFFVKYESIVNAINLARISTKTVRLSSKKCMENGSGPPFGIYAIPNANEYCVFVGPYGINDTLGIETVKTILDVRKAKCTRGIWITTATIDNLKVIDNPLSFLPSKHNKDLIPIDSFTENLQERDNSQLQNRLNFNTHESTYSEPDTTSNSVKINKVKTVKPIKIKRNNSFFTLANSFPKKNSINEVDQLMSTNSLLLSAHAIVNTPANKIQISKDETGISLQNKTNLSNLIKFHKCTNMNTPVRGMVILKPEDINIKLLDNALSTSVSSNRQSDSKIDSMDFENSNKSLLKEDICIISDDEDSENQNNEVNSKDIFINCKSHNIGWIKGKINEHSHISFHFPGCDASNFYLMEEAFEKINQILFTQILVPETERNCLKWELINSEKQIDSNNMLKSEDLGRNMILTKKGLIPDLLAPTTSKQNKTMKTYSKKQFYTTRSKMLSLQKELLKSSDMEEEENIIEVDECSSVDENIQTEEKLAPIKSENSGDEMKALFEDKNKHSIQESLGKSQDDLRQEMSERLKSILLMMDD